MWPDIERAYPWVHKAAHILNNHDAADAATVQRRFDGLVGAMSRHRDSAGDLSDAIDHFGKVTRSYSIPHVSWDIRSYMEGRRI